MNDNHRIQIYLSRHMFHLETGEGGMLAISSYTHAKNRGDGPHAHGTPRHGPLAQSVL